MTPQQIIDACRATNQPLPSGLKIAEVLEKIQCERAKLALLTTRMKAQACQSCQHRDDTHRMNCIECCPVALAERILKEAS